LTEIVSVEDLAPQVKCYLLRTPEIARKRRAGQFVIVRVDEDGERIPLTIADSDPVAGTITLIVQEVGTSTGKMAARRAGDTLAGVVGPLGRPMHIECHGTTVCVGGGIGIAALYPIAVALREAGNRLISILGARNKDLLILEDEMRVVSEEVLICTDDGSYGEKGVVTGPLQELIQRGEQLDLVVAVGPAVMMKFVCVTTQEANIPTVVSLNSIMVDGTGMCGGCRVEVGGETRFCCVDGPEFDGHQVNWDLLMRRQAMYHPQERESHDRHLCRRERNADG